MRQQAWREEPAAYGAPLPVAARWADVDTRRHVNNIAVHGLHQEARQRWWAGVLGEAAFPHNPLPVKPRRVITEFWRECHYPAPLQAAVRAGPLAPDGLVLDSALWQGGATVGAQHSLLCGWSADRAAPTPWPDGWAVTLAAVSGADRSAPAPAPDQTAALDTAPPLDADIACYALRGQLPSRYGDLDADGCTSELATLRAIEQARAMTLQAAWEAAGGEPERDWVRLLVARIDLHWAHHRPPPARWTLAGAVLSRGRSSTVLRVAMFDEAAATLQAVADCVMVYTRPEDDAVAALPPALHAALGGLAWRPGTASAEALDATAPAATAAAPTA